MIRPVLIALIALATGSVQAQEVDCATAETQQDMNACAELDWQAADSALNASYARAMIMMQGIDADLPADQRGAADTLRRAQRSWVMFRDAACAAEAYTMYGGSAQPLLTYGCMARLTAARADDLDQMALPD